MVEMRSSKSDRRQLRRWWFRLVAVALGSVAALVAAELSLHLLRPYRTHEAGRELVQFRQGGADLAGLFETDPILGFRPRLGTRVYDDAGCLRNAYAREKRAEVSRLLFLGDSVTARGRIVAALKAAYGEVAYEFWNAGVESFNTVQEVAYYERHNRQVRPDHVILTFHMNDFETTPVAYEDQDGRLVVFAPKRTARALNPTLFRYSHLYRFYVGLGSGTDTARTEIVNEVRASLASLKRLVQEDQAQLTVLVFPLLKGVDAWKEQERQARATVFRFLRELAIRHFDLYEPLQEALMCGESLSETPEGIWHPNNRAAELIARYLVAHDLLAVKADAKRID